MNYQVINKDCLEALKEIPDNSVDTIITSPPYNIGKQYASYDDNRADYYEWIDNVFQQLRRVLTPNGHFFLNVGWTTKDFLLPYKVLEQAMNHFVLQNNIIWVKHIKIGKTPMGYYQPSQSQHYLSNTWEHLFHLTKSKQTIDKVSFVGEYDETGYYTPEKRMKYKQYSAQRRVARRMGYTQTKDAWQDPLFVEQAQQAASKVKIQEDRRKCEGSVWFINHDPVAARQTYTQDHPCVFPLELVKRCILMADSKVVLDPYAGSFTTGCAAIQLGRDFIGIELSEQYCELGQRRMDAAYQQQQIQMLVE